MQDLFLPLSLTMGVIGWSLVAFWFGVPALARITRRDHLAALILPHVFRYIGLGFLMTGVTAEVLDPRFSEPAAWGDLAAAALALLALLALRQGWSVATPVVWVFNIFGPLDLLYAVTQGTRFGQAPLMGATYFIPAVAVPLLLVTHFLIFRRLRANT